MSMRPAKRILIGILFASAVVLCVLLWRSAAQGDPGGPDQRWFLDLRTRELFAAPSNVLPPIQAPSDQVDGDLNGVIAVVVKKPDGNTEIAFLMSTRVPKDTSWTKPDHRAPVPASGPPQTAAMLVSLPEAKEWVSQSSAQARPIMERVTQLSGGGPVVQDFPR